jgi:hypothetical protein
LWDLVTRAAFLALMDHRRGGFGGHGDIGQKQLCRRPRFQRGDSLDGVALQADKRGAGCLGVFRGRLDDLLDGAAQDQGRRDRQDETHQAADPPRQLEESALIGRRLTDARRLCGRSWRILGHAAPSPGGLVAGDRLASGRAVARQGRSLRPPCGP